LDTPPAENPYQADPDMLYIIINLVYKLKRNSYICDLILLIYTAFMYNLYSDELKTFAWWEVAVVVILTFIQYVLVASKAAFIGRTVIEIAVDKDVLNIKTAAFNGPLWFKKESADHRFKRAEVTVKQMVNPYPDIFKDDKQLTRVNYKGKDVYIVSSYFNPQLATDLKA
jgi:hypothetical protein